MTPNTAGIPAVHGGEDVKGVLPCPFCGSTEGFYVEEGSTFRWRVISCWNCGEGTEVRHKNDSYAVESYIADWNAAAPYPAMLRNEIDNLRAQLAEAQAALKIVMRNAELSKEPCDPDPECPAAIRNGKFASLASIAAQGLGMVRGPSLTKNLVEAQRDAERLDWIIEHRAYVVSDPDCCDGYWLNYARPDGTTWTQATEHETPRAAIDAAMGEPS